MVVCGLVDVWVGGVAGGCMLGGWGCEWVGSVARVLCMHRGHPLCVCVCVCVCMCVCVYIYIYSLPQSNIVWVISIHEQLYGLKHKMHFGLKLLCSVIQHEIYIYNSAIFIFMELFYSHKITFLPCILLIKNF